MPTNYQKAASIMMQGHPEWTESFVQDLIAKDPSVLGLGSLNLVEKERRQAQAGRLALLLEDGSGSSRYEVEVQLGKTDPSRIFRTIEYWDLEKRKDPELSHIAVVVAEEVENRFFNVVSLLNQAIPLIAIKMSAVQLGNCQSIIFTKVLDHSKHPTKRLQDVGPSVDRQEWERKSSPTSMKVVDMFLNLIRTFAPSAELTFKRPYIGLRVDGQVNNFAVFYPQKKNACKLRVYLAQSQAIDDALDAGDLEHEAIHRPRSKYELRLTETEVAGQELLLTDLLRRAFATTSETDLDETPE